MIRRLSLVCLSLLASLAFAAPAGAVTFNYPDFSSIAGLQLNGSAVQEGARVRLTPAEGGKAGSVFATTVVDPQQSFQTQFAISMHGETSPIPGDPADGIAFVIQSKGLDGSESLGGTLGYAGVAPSVAVEFDIYHNLPGDPLGDHVAIMSEGKPEAHLACASESAVSPPCTAVLPFPIYGSAIYAWVEYDGVAQRLKVFLAQTPDRPAAPLLDHQISLASIGSAAYAGFTAATGAHNSIHDVISWRFGPEEAVPTPAITKKGKGKAKKCPVAKGKKGKKGKGKAKKAGASKVKGKAKKGKGKKGKGKKCGQKNKGKKGKKGKGKGRR